ncbi:uncharacterized protein [Watersipora subatra]|uniref:uncharacterized protein n=1 Tax=Watersipora subatra TaxID=2589382 RepID=UPI00355B76EC
MPNIKNKIENHNNRLLANPPTTETKKCNCRTKSDCPLNQNCLQKSIVYQAQVTRLDSNTAETYVGLCETDFKTRRSPLVLLQSTQEKKRCNVMAAHTFSVVWAAAFNFLGPDNDSQDLFLYRQRNYVLHQLLQKECHELLRFKREAIDANHLSSALLTERRVYDRLLNAMVECRAKNSLVRAPASTTTEVVILPGNGSKTATTAEPKKSTVLQGLWSTPRDCQEYYDHGSKTSGPYVIAPPAYNSTEFYVWCDFFDGHGWTVFQKRFNGNVNFYRNWTEYKEGFGNVSDEHWLGLEKLHAITLTNRKMNIRIKEVNKTAVSGTWANVSIDDETSKYKLHVSDSEYTGSLLSVGLSYHDGMAFSTKDQDNDISTLHCAAAYPVVWTTTSNLLGPDNDSQDLFLYQQRNYALHQLLQKECPDLARIKREEFDANHLSSALFAERKVYNRLLNSLVKCRAKDSLIRVPASATTELVTSPGTKSITAMTEQREPSTVSPSLKSTPKDCQEYYDRGLQTSGSYVIAPPAYNGTEFYVWCDFFDGHGWTVFQKRFNGKVNFYRNWTEYKEGFGSVSDEHWLGLEKLHAITLTNRKLNIRIKEVNKTAVSGTWTNVSIDDESSKYKLHVTDSGYTGCLYQFGLAYHDGMAFSTKDQDNDISPMDCAAYYHGEY